MKSNNFSFMNIFIKIEIFYNFSRSIHTTKTFKLRSYKSINSLSSSVVTYLLVSLTRHLIYIHSLQFHHFRHGLNNEKNYISNITFMLKFIAVSYFREFNSAFDLKKIIISYFQCGFCKLT